MARKQDLQEEIRLARELNKEVQETITREGILDSTYQKRVSILDELEQSAGDYNKLKNIEKDIEDEINRLYDTGHTALIDKYDTEKKLVGLSKKKTKAEELSNVAISAGDELTGGMVSKAKDLHGNIGKVGKETALVGAGLSAAAVILISFGAKLDAIGKEFGAIGLQSAGMKSSLLEADVEAIKIGKSLEDVLSVSRNLTDEFGFGLQESIDLSTSILDTSVALGLGTEEGSKLVGALSTIGGLSSDTAQVFSKQVALLAKANDVAPQAVLKDIANSSEAIAKFTDGSVDNLGRAAIQAKGFGSSLNEITGALQQTLDFESSLTSEREASVLIGRTLNLQKVRELTLANDIEGAQIALVKQLGTQSEFGKLNVIQREALTKATGLSLTQIAKIVSQEEEAVTLAGQLAGQPGFDELVGEKGISDLAQLTNGLKSMGALLTNTLGPALNVILKVLNIALKVVEVLFEASGLNFLLRGMGTAVTGLTAAPSLQGGGQVTKTGLAEVHTGETIGQFSSDAIVDAITSLGTDFRDMKNTMGGLKLSTSITNKDLNVILTPANA